MRKVLICILFNCLCSAALATAETSESEPIASAQNNSTTSQDVHLEEEPNSKLSYARKVNNPLASIVMLPIGGQFMTYTDGPAAGLSNFETYARPTFPIVLNDDWKLINHAVIPTYYNTPTLDINANHEIVSANPERQSFFDTAQVMSVFSTNNSKGWNYGIGPNLSIPEGTSYMGSKQYYGLGAAGIVSYEGTHSVFYASIQNSWNINNNGQFFLFNPSYSYNFSSGWFVNSAPFITANFALPNGALNIPVGAGGGKVVRFGRLPIVFSAQAYYNPIKADYYPNAEVKGAITFILPE